MEEKRSALWRDDNSNSEISARSLNDEDVAILLNAIVLGDTNPELIDDV